MIPVQKPKKSIQQELGHKLILFIYGPLVLFFIIILFLIWGLSTSQLGEIHKSLTVVIEQSVREQLNGPVAILENILSDFNDETSRQEALAFMNRIVLEDSPVTDIYVLDSSGIIQYANSEKAGLIGLDYSNYAFFRELDENGGRWFNPVISSITSNVYYTVALRDNEGRTFVCIYTLNSLQPLVERLSGITDSKIAVLDKNRYFLAHTDYEEVEERRQEVVFDSTGSYRILRKNGRSFIFRWSLLEDLGLYVVIYKRLAGFYNPLFISLAVFMLLLAGLFLLVSHFSGTLISRLMRDLNLLLAGAYEVSSGNYSIRVNHSEYSELDILADSFNRMTETLSNVVNDLSESKNEVLKVNEFLKNQYNVTKARERELQLVMENSYDGIILLNLSYEIIRISTAAVKLLNFPAREKGHSGDSLLKFFEKSKHGQIIKQLDYTVSSGTTGLQNYRWDHKIYEIITIPVVPVLEQPLGIILSLRDITEKTELAERLFRSRKLESVGRLASGVAHDFNNIIQAVSGYTSLLKDCDDPDERQTYLKDISATVDTARNLVRQLLDFYKGESGTAEIISLNSITGDMVHMLDQLIGKNIRIIVEPGEGPLLIFAVKNRIEQILINLVVNARDAMNSGGNIVIRTEEIFRNKRPYAVLEVIDQGEGIPEGDRNRIFDPFFSTKEPGSGTGLGLSTVFSIVEDLDGLIEVDSRMGQGTTFRILLPEREE